MGALDLADPTPLKRDGAIQRFEYTLESVVRLGTHYLADVEGITATTPKAVLRARATSGLLTVEEARGTSDG
jgi:hypothetical protein